MRARYNSANTLRRNLAAGLTALLCTAVPAAAAVIQVNLVSNVPGQAAVLDTSLVNPWGMSSSATSPWWVSDNGTGLSTLYNGNTGVKQGLVVTIPTELNGTPPSAPTGQVFNNTTGFVLPNGNKSTFIFATENGTIAGWNGGTNAITKVDMSAGGSAFKGLAIGTSAGSNFLYATDFTNGVVRVFDNNFGLLNLPGAFVDPNLPAGYSPFGIKNLGGKIYVTYAFSAGGLDEVHGAGLGIVDVFDTSGALLSRVASAGGPLDAPWGLAIAPANFDFANDLLVGDFGDGTINAFDPNTYAFVGQLLTQAGTPVQIDGLWDIAFGNGAAAGPTNRLFFTAGPNDEADGLFGVLQAPEPFTLSVFGVGLAGTAFMRRRNRNRTKA